MVNDKMVHKATRGIRNNNPLNIRYVESNKWQGRKPQAPLTPPDWGEGKEKRETEFEQFISMYYGFRAAFITIRNYIMHHQCNTLAKIITRWAPPRVRQQDRKGLIPLPLNQQAACASALPTTTSCGEDPKWVFENDTEGYIRFVCRMTGIGGNENLAPNNPKIKEMVKAMAVMESGAGVKEYFQAADEAWDALPPIVTQKKPLP